MSSGGKRKNEDGEDTETTPAKVKKSNGNGEDTDKDGSAKSKKKHKKESKKSKHKDKKHKHKHKHKHGKEKSKEKGKEKSPKHEVTLVSDDSDDSGDDQPSSPQTASADKVEVSSQGNTIKDSSSSLTVGNDDSVKGLPLPSDIVSNTSESAVSESNKDKTSASQHDETSASQTSKDKTNELHIPAFNVDLKEIELPPDKVTNDIKVKKEVENEKVTHVAKYEKSDQSNLSEDQKKETAGNSHSASQLPDVVDLASIPKPAMPHPNDTIDTPAIPLPKPKESTKKKKKVTESKTSSIQATLRESMMKEVQRDNCDMPQSIVDDMFKDFLASKMQQIEEEYNKMSERFAAGGSTDLEAEIASSVDEMNKLLDAELDSISQNVKEYSKNYHKSQTKSRDHMKSENKETEKSSESSTVKSSDPKVKLGSKAPGKMQLQFKITQSSAEIISSGQQFDKDGNKKDPLEEGEVSTEDDDSKSDDDGDSESEDEADNDEVSGTGSLSDSDKEGGSKSKKKKKKNKKKSKKKHKSSKEKQTTKTDDKSEKKKRSRSRSQSRSSRYSSSADKSRRRSRSRSRSRDRYRKSSYYIYDAYDYRDRRQGSYSDKYRSDRGRDLDRRRSRSRSRDRKRRGSRSRSRDHRSSRSKSRERPFRVSDLRLKIDKSKLREIAIKNALALAKSGHVQNVDVASLKSGGKSINELTDYCKRISSKSKRDDSSSSEDERSVRSDDEEFIHHPFKVKDASSSIVMNIRDSKPLPIQTPQEKLQQQAQLRLTFPVSSGSTHRMKESEWVPVQKTTATATKPSSTATVATTDSAATTSTTTSSSAVPATTVTASNSAVPEPPPPPAVRPEDKVFPDPPQQNLDISAIISERLSAFKKLKQNPHDLDAMKNIAKAQEKASMWAQSKHLPGKFIGSTGANILSQEELMGPDKKRQAWAKKDQFVRAAPLKSGIGMALLQKMGWKEGEGLGKNNEGSLEPLSLDFKTDRKGLTSTGENAKKMMPGKAPVVRDLSGKHPVSALVELCNKRRWGAPDFQLIHESGPDHKKHFLYKVIVHNVAYQPAVASNTKKVAKAAAATACLQELGLVPR
ncbi:hypothetical protein FSP39_023165 [Pinctada imbricata]|uniref:Protein SON n=1 Tax=Pinctada imbricata TaxID=66713 RepID=A0AA88YGE8_PINIB|nr:hypothetical protein FSP39_023165 [Pinctada imbricata]